MGGPRNRQSNFERTHPANQNQTTGIITKPRVGKGESCRGRQGETERRGTRGKAARGKPRSCEVHAPTRATL
eukprot:86070-Alexandrium_andersonii.AAC.1